ncbi:hypothetical protein GCM10027578_18310 [Spirosoma luteolum]
MPSLRYWLLAAGSLLIAPPTSAQRATPAPTLRAFSEQRIRHQRAVGYTLGSYALANVVAGAIGASRTTGETNAFHRMNAYWNLVNLGLSGATLLALRHKTGEGESLATAVRQHETMKQVLLVNAGLDVAYVMGGLYLRERGRADAPGGATDKAAQQRGYGRSIMLQGGFLFAFDLVNYLIFKRRGDRQEGLLLGAGPDGVGLVMPIR